jgi:hypothetical protein
LASTPRVDCNNELPYDVTLMWRPLRGNNGQIEGHVI